MVEGVGVGDGVAVGDPVPVFVSVAVLEEVKEVVGVGV